MNAKKLFVAAALLAGLFSAKAQSVQLSNTTGFGYENGAVYDSGEYNESTFVGALAGKGSNPKSTFGKNTFVGHHSGMVTTTGDHNSFLGRFSGLSNTTGSMNVFGGANSGYSNVDGSNNVFLGGQSGFSNVSGTRNTFTGINAGFYNTASDNSFYGAYAGISNSTGYNNVFIGTDAGYTNSTGYSNTLVGSQSGKNMNGAMNVSLGYQAGHSTLGNSNVFLGYRAGYSETGSNKLYIANSDTTTPLIYGDFASNKLGVGGINTFPTTAGTVNVSAYSLFVKGGILTEEVRVMLQSGWADYVFANDYKLTPLSEVETFIKENNHLPNVPSASQVATDGIELGEMSKIQQEKIEELTLYAIQQDKTIKKQEDKIEEQNKKLNDLSLQLQNLSIQVQELIKNK